MTPKAILQDEYQNVKPSTCDTLYENSQPLIQNMENLRKITQQQQHKQHELNMNCEITRAPTSESDINAPIIANDENVFDAPGPLSTLKSGPMSQKQNFAEFHKQLLSTWKKRFFVLTTDYLVCLERSTPKVGRSEMGKFLYKISLNDIVKINWAKQRRNDRGIISLRINGQFNLYLWTKDCLDEWMQLIKKAAIACKNRRELAYQMRLQIASSNKQQIALDNGNNVHPVDLSKNETVEEVLPSTQAHLQSPVVAKNQTSAMHFKQQQQQQQQQVVSSKRDLVEGQRESRSKLCFHEDDRQNDDAVAIDDNDRQNGDCQARAESTNNLLYENAKQVHIKQDLGSTIAANTGIFRNQQEDEEAAIASCSKAMTNNQTETNQSHQQAHEDSIKKDKLSYTKKQSSRDSDASVKSVSSKGKVTQSSPNQGSHQRNKSKKDSKTYKINEDKNSKIKSNSTNKYNKDNIFYANNTNEASEKNKNIINSAETSQTLINDSDANKEEQNLRRSSETSVCLNSTSSLSSSSATGGRYSGLKLSKKDDMISNSRNSSLNSNSTKQIASGTNDESSDSITRKARKSRAGQISNDNSTSSSLLSSSRILRNDESLKKELLLNPETPKMSTSKTSAGLEDANKETANESINMSTSNSVNVSLAPRPLPSRLDTNRLNDKPAVVNSKVNDIILGNINNINASPRNLSKPTMMGSEQRKGIFVKNHQFQSESIDVASLYTQEHRNSTPLKREQSLKANSQLGMQEDYREKLMELQMMHADANYGKLGAESDVYGANDFQLYQTSNNISAHNNGTNYGYGSMRANLKSAKNEFAFYRPESTKGYLQDYRRMPHHQSTLPRKPFRDNLSTNFQSPNSSSSFLQSAMKQRASLIIDINNENKSSLPRTYVDQDTSSAIQSASVVVVGKSHQFVNNTSYDESMASNCALPIKPNRKPNNHRTKDQIKSSSTLKSSILQFFRYAFWSSKRKSKHKRNKSVRSAGSCASSLCAYDDGVGFVPIIPSAFSTGGKSIAARKQEVDAMEVSQQLRVVDMIEALASDQVEQQQQQQQQQQQPKFKNQKAKKLNSTNDRIKHDEIKSHKSTVLQNNNNNNRQQFNQFGSPLHKSNSISTTMSTTNSLKDTDNLQRISMLARCHESKGLIGSPMLSRRLDANIISESPNRQYNKSISNNRLPRPSSMYGQPSMMFSHSPSRNDCTNFAQQSNRNSIHGILLDHASSNDMLPIDQVQGFMDNRDQKNSSERNNNCERNEQYDLTNDFSDLDNMIALQQKQQFFDNLHSRHSKQQNTRKAVVNPIQQSPILDSIYDNHNPSFRHNYDNMNDQYHRNTNSQSYYDNSTIVNQQTSNAIHMSIQSGTAFNATPSKVFQSGYVSSNQLSNEVDGNSNDSLSKNCEINQNRIYYNKKPSAIIAPNTPNHIRHDSNLSIIPNPARSPLANRRVMQTNYQQSPLCRQTRVLNKANGLQTTIIGEERIEGSSSDTPDGVIEQKVINIAGAPGVNLDPSLAASLLKGTNIDVYETSTFKKSSQQSGELVTNEKAFVVSRRLGQVASDNNSNADNNHDRKSQIIMESSCELLTI